MTLGKLSFPAKTLMTVATALVLVNCSWAGDKYKVLHAFTGGKDGGGLYSGLLLDRQGNVYGTAVAGGAKGKGGTAFKLRPLANGKWAEAVLYNFCSEPECRDGGGPNASLIFDAAGNLYGTTESGGAHVYGTVFKLTPRAEGWKETVVHSFGFNKYGCCPQASLVIDDAGNLFGTASVAFELSPGTDGWRETLLHDFTGQHGDGSGAYAGLILDAAGNLYSMTLHGGTGTGCGGGCGTVYQLQSTSAGWKEHILHDFGTGGDNMAYPEGPLMLDKMGNLYGTAGGGTYADGAVYKLTLQSDGRWKSTIIHSFTGGANGQSVGGGVVMDKAGNLYGTTIAGGSPNCECGLVYKVSPGAEGKWNFKVLHTFVGTDGAQPVGELILDDKGNLYGNTITGGTGGYGVAFKLTP
jgi:uncharacterized repeat protein (TIGR03803 family)